MVAIGYIESDLWVETLSDSAVYMAKSYLTVENYSKVKNLRATISKLNSIISIIYYL